MVVVGKFAAEDGAGAPNEVVIEPTGATVVVIAEGLEVVVEAAAAAEKKHVAAEAADDGGATKTKIAAVEAHPGVRKGAKTTAAATRRLARRLPKEGLKGRPLRRAQPNAAEAVAPAALRGGRSGRTWRI